MCQIHLFNTRFARDSAPRIDSWFRIPLERVEIYLQGNTKEMGNQMGVACVWREMVGYTFWRSV